MSTYIINGKKTLFYTASMRQPLPVGRVFTGVFPTLPLIGVEARVVAVDRKQSSLFGSFGPYHVVYTLEINGRHYELNEEDVEVKL